MTDLTRRDLGRVGLATAAAALLPAAGEAVRYRDPGAPIPDRVADLLARMTLDEKVAQLVGVSAGKTGFEDAANQFDRAGARIAFPHGIGHICSPSLGHLGRAGIDPTRTASETARYMNDLQRWAIEDTRLGIPVLAHEEALHGLARRDATSFPQAIGLASSWDPDLLTRVFAHAAAETRARGVHLVLTPVVDVARDPRWGRCEETYGEDTFLCAEMGVAAIRGFQGDTARGLAPDRVFATVKHFAGHGASEGGDNTAPMVTEGERTFRTALLPPYRAAIERGHAAAVMPTYHEIDGVPMTANRHLVTDVLRGEWGFTGITVADYGSIRELRTIHRIAATDADAAALAMNAGVDVELPDAQCYPLLPSLVASGRVPLAAIDAAVARVLTIKFAAGLFDSPYVDAAAADARTGTARGRAFAREAAGRTMILLKNDRATLPFAAERVGRLAVLGIAASDTPIGGYSDVPRQVVSVLDGLRAEAHGRLEVDYAVGVRLTKTRNWYGNDVIVPTPAEAKALRDEALAVAARADRVLLVLGDNEETSREAWSSQHMGDRTSLDLWGEQEALAEAVLALGKPVVLLLLNGRPPSIPFIAEHADAIVEGWYLGQETGLAVADVLFGRVNPGGKLPISIPRSVGQLPSYYSVKPSARRGYLDDTTAPLWAFGHGLSYTRFDLSAPRLPAVSRAGDAVVVEVDVVNRGDRAGDEVVQVYVHPVVSQVTAPVRALKGFQRLTLAAGERRTVRVTLRADAFAIVDLDMRETVVPGDFVVEAGASLADLKAATLTVRA